MTEMVAFMCFVFHSLNLLSIKIVSGLYSCLHNGYSSVLEQNAMCCHRNMALNWHKAISATNSFTKINLFSLSIPYHYIYSYQFINQQKLGGWEYGIEAICMCIVFSYACGDRSGTLL